MHTSPSAQATWSTSTMFPTRSYEAPNFRRARKDQNENNEVHLTNLDRFRRSPAPSVSPTRARFAAMDHVAKGSVGEEPLNYADVHPTFGMGRSLTRTDAPNAIPRLRSRSRSSSFKNTADPQAFGGAQYTRSTIVDRNPRAARAPYGIGPAADQDDAIKSHERTQDLDTFWRKFKSWEDNYADFPDRVFHYIPDIGHLNKQGNPYFRDSHFPKSLVFLQTMIAKYARAYSYEMRAMDVQNFSLERFEKQHPALAKTIDDVVDCRGGVYQFFEEADSRVHLVQAIVAKKIEAECFLLNLFGATPEDDDKFDEIDNRDSKAHSALTRTILAGAPVPQNFLPEVRLLTGHISQLLAPLRALSPNPLTTSPSTASESTDALTALVLWAAKLAVDMRVQNARWSFSWPPVFLSPWHEPRYDVVNPDVLDHPAYASRYPPIVALALFPVAISTPPKGPAIQFGRAAVSVRRANGPALLARPETSFADLVAFEKRHGRRPTLESPLIDPGAHAADLDSSSTTSDSDSPSSNTTIEPNTPQKPGSGFFSTLSHLLTPSTPHSPWRKRLLRILALGDTPAEARLPRPTEDRAFAALRAVLILAAVAHAWSAPGPNAFTALFWTSWFALEVCALRSCAQRGMDARRPGLYIWVVALMAWRMGLVRWEGWETVQARKERWGWNPRWRSGGRWY